VDDRTVRPLKVFHVGCVAIACLLLVMGCTPLNPTSQQPATSISTSTSSETAGFLLPTIPAALETNPTCAGVGMSPLTLRGALINEQASVWAETQGPNVAVLWPRGYRARFEPALVIVNPVGMEVARDGADMSVGVWPGLLLCPIADGPDLVVYMLPMPSPS
jgi:hypothetical protein